MSVRYLRLQRFDARPQLPTSAAGWFLHLGAIWLFLLAVFYAFPQIDLAVASAFFKQTICGESLVHRNVCGNFPYAAETGLVILRKFFLYLPSLVALILLFRMLDNFQHHGATYDIRRTRSHSIALTAFAIGPYLLVNLILKSISARPRPTQTDLFGGANLFVPAGDFNGTCTGNCSFVSGEAAGTGWLACLVVFLPPHLRPVFGPPLVVVSLVSPALRVAFGGHYLSDVTLGWLSSLVVYAGVAAYFEMTQQAKKPNPQTIL